jgi:hypothetical protein
VRTRASEFQTFQGSRSIRISRSEIAPRARMPGAFSPPSLSLGALAFRDIYLLATSRAFERASAWFAQAQRWSPEPKDKPFLAGALADAAYAYWRAGKPKQAVTAAIDAWEVADSLPAGKEDLRAFATKKRVGHVIAWLHGVIIADRGSQVHEPVAGMCSDPAIAEGIRELEATESAGVWVFFMRMERKCYAGYKAARLGDAPIKASTSILIRPLIVEENITRGLLTGDVADLPKKCVELMTAARDAALAYPKLPNKFALGHEPEMFFRGDLFVGAPLFLAGLVSAAAIGTPIARPSLFSRSGAVLVRHRHH